MFSGVDAVTKPESKEKMKYRRLYSKEMGKGERENDCNQETKQDFLGQCKKHIKYLKTKYCLF